MTTKILFDNPKFDRNIGTIARTGELCGLDQLIITSYDRLRRSRSHATDTAHSFQRIGQFSTTDAENVIAEHKDIGFVIVAIELSTTATPLPEFNHPDNVLFVLGAEDVGVKQSVLDLCDIHVTIPANKPWSHNVAEAATIVLYDNFVNQQER